MADTITLCGEEIEVFDLPIREVHKWRAKSKIVLAAQETITKDLQDLPEDDDSVKAGISSAYTQYLSLLDEHSETILELVLEYVPESKRDDYANKVTEPEVLEAFFVLARKSYSNVFFLADGIRSTSSWLDRQSDWDELSRSEWGIWSSDLDTLALYDLVDSWILRKKVEAKILVNAFNDPGTEEKMHADELMSLIGVPAKYGN